MIRIVIQSTLPEGYNEADYLIDHGACLRERYATADAARNAIESSYKGADVDGVGLDWVYVDTRDHSEVHPRKLRDPLPRFRGGARVRTLRTIDRFPDFMVAAGAAGVVVQSNDAILRVRMDATIPGAEEWDNEIHWYRGNDEDVAADVEVLDGSTT